MKVGVILIIATFIGFISMAMLTNNIWLSFIGSGLSIVATASVIWRVDFGTWNPFS